MTMMSSCTLEYTSIGKYVHCRLSYNYPAEEMCMEILEIKVTMTTDRVERHTHTELRNMDATYHYMVHNTH